MKNVLRRSLIHDPLTSSSGHRRPDNQWRTFGEQVEKCIVA
jgi:hypothetical protein